MKPLPPHLEAQRKQMARDYLFDFGWEYLGGWLFKKNNQVHDMSAADLTLHETILANKHFLVEV